MCSTIYPCLGANCTSFLQTKHFCKAPTSSSHRNLTSCFLLTPGLRSGGRKYDRLSHLSRGPLFYFPTNHAFW